MSPEQSRRVDAALDQLRALQRPNPHQPVLLDTRGSTARVAHQEATVATPEIKPPDEEFDEIGQDPVGAEVLAPGRSAFTDDQMPWATSHSTRISPRTCSGTWSPVATVMIEPRTAPLRRPKQRRRGSAVPKASAGVAHPSTRRGRWLTFAATELSASWVSVPVGVLVQVLAQQPIGVLVGALSA